ncbi:MAG: wcoA [Microbacteriaceae bacterium]|nr:wcoA [Microbacteriaceae bacterium]
MQVIALVAAIAAVVTGAIEVVVVSNKPAVSISPPGAAPLGSVSYEVPKGALFVSPMGSDRAKGTKAEPLRSVQRAITLARSGQTIVLRAGSYHEWVTVTRDKTVTIQPYLKEVVWFDGSVVVGNWRKEGSVWISDGWTTQFDSSPTFFRGAPDNTEPGWIFLDPQFPLAAHPDQVWIDGKAETQVAKPADVVAGTFAVDTAASRLYLGSDPTGHEVRSSDKPKALGIQSKNSVVRGIGIHRYATSVPGFGAMSVEAPGVIVDNVLIEDNATAGLFVTASRVTVRQVTVRGNGMMGMGANYADDLLVTGLLATGNNTQHFNNAPVSGGFKITRSRTVTIEKSRISGNFGPGLWFDQSDYATNVVANDISDNVGHGLILEISARFVVAGNTISNNRDNGIKLNDTSDVQIWNNTVVANGINLRVAQDYRRASDLTVPGHDPRRSLPDPKMTWIVGNITVSNNIFSGATADSVVSVEDYSGEYTAAELGVTLDGNLYQRKDASSPKSLVVWSVGPGDPRRENLKAFTAAAGQEKHGVELSFAAASKATWMASGPVSTAAANNARVVPKAVLKLLGWDTSVHRLGAR